MYSPKIKEELIPVLYQIAKANKKPMTRFVNELIEEALKKVDIKMVERQMEAGGINIACVAILSVLGRHNGRDNS